LKLRWITCNCSCSGNANWLLGRDDNCNHNWLLASSNCHNTARNRRHVSQIVYRTT